MFNKEPVGLTEKHLASWRKEGPINMKNFMKKYKIDINIGFEI